MRTHTCIHTYLPVTCDYIYVYMIYVAIYNIYMFIELNMTASEG